MSTTWVRRPGLSRMRTVLDPNPYEPAMPIGAKFRAVRSRDGKQVGELVYPGASPALPDNEERESGLALTLSVDQHGLCARHGESIAGSSPALLSTCRTITSALAKRKARIIKAWLQNEISSDPERAHVKASETK